MEDITESKEHDIVNKRVKVITALVITLLIIFLLKVLYTALHSNESPIKKREIQNRALRGSIISSDGYTISRSIKKYSASIHVGYLDTNKKSFFLTLFSIYTHTPVSEIKKRMLDKNGKAKKGWVVLADDIDAKTAIYLRELKYKLNRFKVFKAKGVNKNFFYGLTITEKGESREYPLKEAMSPILGYTRTVEKNHYTHIIGYNGIEKFYEKYLNKKTEAVSIYYSTTSKKLAFQVQHLLLKLGIISFIKQNKKAKYRINYHVHIYGKENQLKFLEQVGCHGNRGREIPNLIKILKQKRENPNIDTIPKELWEYEIKGLKEIARISWRTFAKELNIAYCGSNIFKYSISRNKLLKIAQILNAIKLYQLATSYILWDEIVSIEELGIEDVYDMTVEETHNFIANDIIVHNSIEQDADTVMFIHRPEYYKKNPTPEEQGLAEIIIAKQRNGPTGTINLAFIKEITKFENLAKTSPEGYVEEEIVEEEFGDVGEVEI